LTSIRTSVIIYSISEYTHLNNRPYVCGSKHRALTHTASGVAAQANRILLEGRSCECHGITRLFVQRFGRRLTKESSP
jgi:hypothetical protein